MPALSKTRVLVVDDDADVRDVVKTILERAQYEVAVAGDGAEALRVIAGWQPAAIVTDIVMPQEEGLRLIFEARKLQPGLPIVAISGARYGRYLTLAKQLGADAVLDKPFDPPALLAAVAGVLATRA